MPWSYCRKCGGELSDWREGFEGCKQCGKSHIEIDDPDAMCAIQNLLEEVEELQEQLTSLEDWLWENHRRDCPHRIKSQRYGMGDGCTMSLSHDCGRKHCPTFVKRR